MTSEVPVQVPAQIRAGRPARQPAGSGGRPTAEDAARLARHTFRAGRRIDMSALADELGVNRVTLYRWVGSRERLIVDVLWRLAERVLAWSKEQAAAEGAVQGGERVVQVVRIFLDRVIRDEGMRRFVSEEGELAMRLLTRAEPGFQPRLVAAVRELLEEETERGALDLPADLNEVAFVVVRVIESYTYLDLILGEQPDAARAEPILRLLLR